MILVEKAESAKSAVSAEKSIKRVVSSEERLESSERVDSSAERLENVKKEEIEDREEREESKKDGDQAASKRDCQEPEVPANLTDSAPKPMTNKYKTSSFHLNFMYKPILRRFRSCIRQTFDQGRKRFYLHWSHQDYLENVRQFMDQLQIPQELRCYDNVLKLLTIIFPCTVKQIDMTNCRIERLKFVAVFRENSSKRRRDFFSDPLVKFLWQTVFMPANPYLVKDHLRRIKSEASDGDVAVVRFLESVQQMERELDFKFVPDHIKLDYNEIAAFSKEEAYEYLL